MRLRRTPTFHDNWICRNQETQSIRGILIISTICFCVKNIQNLMILGPFYTRAWGPLSCDAHIKWLVEKIETIQVHFTLDLERKNDQLFLARMKNWHGILHGIKWIMFHGLQDIALDSLKRGESNAKQGAPIPIKLPLAPRNIILLWWVPKPEHMLGFLNMVLAHFTQCLRAHQLQNWISISHNSTFGWFQEPIDFHGHGFWLCLKQPLIWWPIYIVMCN